MKYSLALLPILFVFGCTPATPAESPAPTVASSAEPATTATADAKPVETAAPAMTAAPPATAAPAAPPAAPSPPTVTGTLGGKEFKPKAAITMGPLYEGRVLIALTEYDAACGKAYEPKEGDRTMAMSIEWKQGEVAFGKSKETKKGGGDPFFTTVGKDKKPKQTVYKATGKAELTSAPTEVDKSTRLKLDLASGKDTLKGDIELFVCWEIKQPPKQ